MADSWTAGQRNGVTGQQRLRTRGSGCPMGGSTIVTCWYEERETLVLISKCRLVVAGADLALLDEASEELCLLLMAPKPLLVLA